jgi:hypothetical protein
MLHNQNYKKMALVIFYLISHQLLVYFEYLNYKNRDFFIAEKASYEVMSISMNPFLANEQLDFVAYKVIENI